MGTGGDPLRRANGSCLHVHVCVRWGLTTLVGIDFRQFTMRVGTFPAVRALWMEREDYFYVSPSKIQPL